MLVGLRQYAVLLESAAITSLMVAIAGSNNRLTPAAAAIAVIFAFHTWNLDMACTSSVLSAMELSYCLISSADD